MEKLSYGAKEILKILILEGLMKFKVDTNELKQWAEMHALNYKIIQELINQKILIKISESGGTRVIEYFQLQESYRKCLEELLWER